MSYRIMETYNSQESRNKKPFISYRTSCDCHDPDCDMWIELEYDHEVDELFLNLSHKFYPKGYWLSQDSWFRWLRNRIRYAWRVLINGNIQVESEFIFGGKTHIQAFIDTLQEGVNRIENDKVQK